MPAFSSAPAYSFVSFKYCLWNRSHLGIRACQSPKYLTIGYQPAANYRHSKSAVFALTDRIFYADCTSQTLGTGGVGHLSRNDCGRGDTIRRTSTEPSADHERFCA